MISFCGYIIFYYINDYRDGYGKEIFENGEYYIGEYKNNLRHGKGTDYYSNGNINYEGEYSNGKKEGNGKVFMKMIHII